MFPIINAAVNEAMEMTDNTEALKNNVIFDNRDIAGFYACGTGRAQRAQ
jgi:hypothetical protein